MIQTDRQYYRTVMSAVGRTMLIFVLLFNIFSVVITVLDLALASAPYIFSYTIYQLFYTIGYMLSFILPVWFLHRFLRSSGCAVQPMFHSVCVSPMLLPIVFAGVTVCFAMAEINAVLVEPLGYYDIEGNLNWETFEELAPYEIVLLFLSNSVAPAFCEEFLFRGAILSNCRPFGRANAVLISAVLFALMHQNPSQLLYTFAAGIVLGLVYEYTGSIWNCIILHLLNNFVSVIQTVVTYKYALTVRGEAIMAIIEAVIYFIGAISLGIIVSKHFAKRQTAEEGIFEKSLPTTDDYALHPIRGREAARLFFCPSIIVFVLYVVAQMVWLTMLYFAW